MQRKSDMAFRHQRMDERDNPDNCTNSLGISLVKVAVNGRDATDSSHDHIADGHGGHCHAETFREMLVHVFHSYKFHLLVVALVILDCFFVIAELIIDVQILSQSQCPRTDVRSAHADPDVLHSDSQSPHSADVSHQIVTVLKYLSIILLSLFTFELLLKVYAFRLQFFKSKTDLFDAFVVLTSLVLDIVFFRHEDTSQIFHLIIILRLWRIARVVHGIIVSVKTPVEHSLHKEKKHREQMEREVEDHKQYELSLEREIDKLRLLLVEYNLSELLPETSVKSPADRSDNSQMVVSVDINRQSVD